MFEQLLALAILRPSSEGAMASVPAPGMISLGVTMGVEGATNDAVVAVWNEMKTVKPFPRSDKVISAGPDPLGTIRVTDLPLAPTLAQDRMLKSAFDVILNYEGEVDLEDIKDKMEKNDYKSLPAPFAPSPDVADGQLYTMSLHITPAPDDNGHNIIKAFTFEKQLSVASIEAGFVEGVLHQLSWGQDRPRGARFQKLSA
jgi:hypothetical protein